MQELGSVGKMTPSNIVKDVVFRFETHFRQGYNMMIKKKHLLTPEQET